MSSGRPCPACTGAEVSRRLTIREQMYGTGEEFDYLECAACSSLFIEEIPSDLARYYDTSAYYSFDEDPESVMGRPGVAQATALIGRAVLHGPERLMTRALAFAPKRELRTLVALFESVRMAGLPRGRKTRVLDVGAGAGSFVYALGLAGMEEVIGIDPFVDEDRQVGARGKVLRLGLADVDGEFDLVMMHHSLEHVPDPRETMVLARALLSPAGRLVVRMPTVSSAAFEEYGPAWIGCDAPRHLTVFSRDGMATACRDTAFDIARVVDDSNESQFWAGEQNRAGVPLASATSQFVSPRSSMFSSSQLRAWRREAARLNKISRGDQAAWVLVPTSGSPPA